MPIGGTAFFGANQSPRITTNYLNQLNRKGDPAPGVPVSTAQASGSIVQPYSGFIGGKLTLTNPFAAPYGDPAVGPLYGGTYQYVQLDPASATPTRGQVLYWSDELNYKVTLTAAGHKIAGIALNATTPGNWDFIQIGGIASVSFSASGTIGELVSAAGNQGATGTVIDATFLGIAVLTAPASGAVSPVELNIAAGMNY